MRTPLFVLGATLAALAMTACHASDPAPRFVVSADAARVANDHVDVKVSVRNDAGPATGPLCMRAEWMDAQTNLLEAQETCSDAHLGAGETMTFVIHSYGSLHVSGGHIVVAALYGGGQFAGSETLSIVAPS